MNLQPPDDCVFRILGTNVYNRYAMCPAEHLYPVMVNGIRASDPRSLNKGRGSKFRVGSLVSQETPKEGSRAYRPKRCEYKNKDEDNSLKTEW